MYGTVIAVGPNSMSIMKDDIRLISADNTSTSTSNSSFLYLTSGEIGIEYKPTNVLYSSRSLTANNFNIVIDGSLEMGYLYFSEYGGQIELDTRQFHVPFSSKISVYVDSGSTLNINKKVKFLMGSKLIVKEGGTLNVNESLAFYNSQTAPERNTSLGIYYDSTGKDDAILECNGTLKINSNSSNAGYLGARITHSSTTDNAKVDLTSISNSSYLTATVPEGTSDTTVIITSSGYFLDSGEVFLAQFSSGGTYTSGNIDTEYYWNGTFVATQNITVTYDTTVTFPVFNYTILLSANSDGSNSYSSELANSSSEGSTSVSRGAYFNLVVNDAASVTITKNGTQNITYNSSSWIHIDGDFAIHIVPSEGVLIKVSTYKDTNYSDKEAQWSQGTGHTIYYVQESTSQNGTYTETFRQQSNGFEYYVKKGNYFKVGYTWDSADLFISASGYNGFTANNRIYTNDANFSPQPTTSWNNDTTSSLSGAFLAGNNNTAPGLEYHIELGYYSGHAKADDSSTCITADTLILMADGTYKQAIDVKANDLVMTINHETGEFEAAPVIFNDDIDKEAEEYNAIYLNFSNGETVKMVYEHGFFDFDTMQYEYIKEENYHDFIGHTFATYEGSGTNGKVGRAILEDAYIKTEITQICSPISFKNLNIITENMISMPGGIAGLFNYFDYDEDLSYNEEKKVEDISTYGLFDYSHFEDRIPYEIYEAFNGKYLKVAIGKGLLTEEIINQYIERYIPIIEDQQGESA